MVRGSRSQGSIGSPDGRPPKVSQPAAQSFFAHGVKMSDNHNQTIGQRVRRSDVAEFFGVERSTVTDWCRKGMPIRLDGTTSLPAVVQWYGCFGPGRNESWRDDTLRQYIAELLDR